MGSNWIPEIMYEESDEGSSSNIPFIMVPKEQVMPKILFIFESRETGEFEPGSEGNEVPVFEWDLHQYADMLVLKEGLDSETYDKVRSALGLEPLKVAAEKGLKIGQNVRSNLG
ncbi:MAG TPA: hypothetical protein DF712_17625 [Balneola sp.]|nr:hypothetical protein [Balneola sp.]